MEGSRAVVGDVVGVELNEVRFNRSNGFSLAHHTSSLGLPIAPHGYLRGKDDLVQNEMGDGVPG